MVQVQVRIAIGDDGRVQAEIDVLAREDATETERGLAESLETTARGWFHALAEANGATVDQENLIGPQHATERAGADLLDALAQLEAGSAPPFAYNMAQVDQVLDRWRAYQETLKTGEA